MRGRRTARSLALLMLAASLAPSAAAALVPSRAAAAMTASAPAAAAAPTPRTSLPDVEKDVMCPVCGLPLNVAESPQADRERVYIRSLIAQGETKDQIKRALVNQFGPGVLALPSRSGFDLVVYVVPIVVVIVLAALVALLLPRWRRRSRAADAIAAPALSSAETARLDADLARFDR